jgi:basic membrane protein A
MRTLLSLFLVLVLMLALGVGVGCTTEEDGEEDTTEETTEEEAMPGEGFKAAMVTDVGGLGDKSFNDLAYLGLTRAEEDLGIEIDALESSEIADYAPNVDQLVTADYDQIFTVGFLMTDTTVAKSVEYPDVLFGGIDQFLEEPEANAVGLLFQENEGAYLAGVVAGLSTISDYDERLNDENKIGFVGGEDIPPVQAFEAGYIAGARSVNPDIEVISLYAGSFTDQAKGKELALSLIDQGCDVVFAAAGLTGVGSVTAAQEAGSLFIGVDADQYETIPDSGDVMLTSAIKRVDEAVYQTIEAMVMDEYEGGQNLSFGLAEEGVGLAPYHDFEDVVPQEIKDAVDEAEQDVLDGTVTVPYTRDELADWEPPA